MRTLIIASGNAHKAEEFQQLLAETDFSVQSAAVSGGMPDVEENGGTFAANAQLKAEALRELAPSDGWVLADDSGLEVDALGGAPGIYSARYAGEGASDGDNLQKLLEEMFETEEGKRTARFRCVLCLIGPSGELSFFDGTCEGRISREPAGGSGFGYDPVFVPDGYEESFAELGDAVKGKLSHRGRAVQALIAGVV